MMFSSRITANSAHWNMQDFWNLSVTNGISKLCNNKVAMVLRQLFAFANHKMFLVRHLNNETPFLQEPADIHLNDKGQECFVIFWWKFYFNNTFSNIFTEKNGHVLNTYFTHRIQYTIIQL